ncbi:MAG: hypothetical protein ACHQQQ_10165 [Bacteroidota bacterium]
MAVLLAGAGIGLFMMQKPKLVPIVQKPVEQKDWHTDLPVIDSEIDTILVHFGIEKTWLKKKQYPIPETNLSRVERKIELPLDILPVQMNQVLNTMVHKYNARAIASENSKEHLVTIHVVLNGYVIQTLILHPNASLKRTVNTAPQQSKA